MKCFTLCIAFFLSLSAPLEAAERSGALNGTIVTRDASKNELTVSHAAVPGLMGAMTMAYQVRGQSVSALPKDGTKISAMLHESNGEYWLTGVKAAASAEMSMQMEQPTHSMPMPMPMHQHGDPVSELLMRQASGTAMNPDAAAMHMTMTHWEDWTIMLHGQAFVNEVIQSGPRGKDKLFSTNWIMGMADRPLQGGHLMVRSMLSLEPLTVGKMYPELFQTGETHDHRPLVDAQHPHDFVMELAVEYARPLPNNMIGYVYAAPFGDPALGPVGFPHRASASEIPQAPLSHHVQDSTHIAGSVLTLGVQSGMYGLALSGFHGQEPDENRWDIDTGRIDSWAARFTFDPTPNLSAQISTGHLKHPEAAEPGNIQRTTVSVAYSQAVSLGQWDSSLIFGHNQKTEGHSTSSWLAESVLKFDERNYVTGRAEIVDKDELFANQDVPAAIANESFRIKALTIGYSRDLLDTGTILGAVGVNVTRYAVPGSIKPYYGDNPKSFYVFARLRSGKE